MRDLIFADSYLKINEDRVTVSIDGDIRLGYGLSQIACDDLRHRFIELRCEGFGFEMIKMQIEKEARKVENSVRMISLALPHHGFHALKFVLQSLVECDPKRSIHTNCSRLIDRLIHRLHQRRDPAYSFYAYRGIKEDLALRVYEVLKGDVPDSLLQTPRAKQLVPKLRAYLSWKIESGRRGFPMMPGEEYALIPQPAVRLHPLEHMFNQIQSKAVS